MPQEDSLHKRGHAMEEAFFKAKDADLLEKLRQKRLAEVTKEDIATATGIRDEELLDRLISMEINVQTLSALAVIPLIEVAWASGRVEPAERDAILESADAAGVQKDGPGYRLLNEWLADPPDPQMLACWKDYIAALADTLDEKLYANVRDNLISRARDVAQAAGGILGIGAICAAEKQKLADLEAAFK